MALIFKNEPREKRGFNYTPRYYDKNTSDIRKQKIEEGCDDTNVDFADRLHQKLNATRKANQVSNRRLIIMIVLLMVLLFILLR
ncbi:MAG: hypothetical protein J5701_01470 [Bacteroidales bacterium]|nr:hypothetical protein [Bacteroidales bacterium]